MHRTALRIAAALLALAPTVAFAHPGHDGASLVSGFIHPLGGLDHIIAMVAVGLLAARLGGRALWLVPASFVAAMAVAGVAASAGMGLPYVETGIAVSVVVLAEAAGLPRGIILSLAPKSVTAGVAMGISESLHADPSLTAVAVVLTGIMGAIIVTPLMNRMGITDFRARGFAVGVAAHGIGTARAFQVDAVAGVFAGIAMSLNALVTSLLVPVAVTLLVR